MLILLLFFSILHCVHPHGGFEEYYGCEVESSNRVSRALVELKQTLDESKETGRDMEEAIMVFIARTRANLDNFMLKSAARGAALGDFERVCRSNAALFCDSVHVHPTPNPPSSTPSSSASAFMTAVGGEPRCLRFTSTGYFLRSWGPTNREPTLIDFASHCNRNEYWKFEQRIGLMDKVLIIGYANTFVRAYANGTVGDAPRHGSQIPPTDMWEPVQNEDGSWSLRSYWGSYLSNGCPANLACAKYQNSERERFELAPNAVPETPTTAESTTAAPSTITPDFVIASFLDAFGSSGRCLRFYSVNSTNEYLRSWGGKNSSLLHVDRSPHCQDYELWTAQQAPGQSDKVLLIGWADTYARARADGLVEDVVAVDRVVSDADYWSPESNEDGSWSLKDTYGRYLPAMALMRAPCRITRFASTSGWSKMRKATPPTEETTTTESTTTTTTAPSTTTTEEVTEFMAAVGGKARCLRFSSSEFLRTWGGPKGGPPAYLDMAEHCQRNEKWTFQPVEGESDKVLLVGWDASYVRARSSGVVDDIPPLGREPSTADHWTPVRNDDGSWSLKDIYGRYLSRACKDKLACTQPENLDREHFWLE